MKRSLAYCFLYFSTDYPSWRKFSARGTDMNAMKTAFRRLSRPVFSHLTGFKTTFTLFPLFPLISPRVCLFSRRLLTRTARLGTGWGFVKSRTTLISPGEAAASETKFPYRSVHRSHRRKKFAFRITREASERESAPFRSPRANRGKWPADRFFRLRRWWGSSEYIREIYQIFPNTRDRHVSRRRMKENSRRLAEIDCYRLRANLAQI